MTFTHDNVGLRTAYYTCLYLWAAANEAALLLAIGLGHYVIGSRTLTSDVGGTWAEGPVWPQYALDVLAAAIGGFLGAAVLQLIGAWRKRTGKLAKTGIQ